MKNNLPVLFYDTNGFDELAQFLDKQTYSKLFILVNQKTKRFCLPLFDKHNKHPYHRIEIKDGESHKNIKTVQYIWEQLTLLGADRQSILINLGGGVITDIGGFAAATFKRGIRFINIPTTVLAMVDAAIGGKTGIDFQGLKNQVGVFQNAIALWINSAFLNTLDKRELASGLAEILKYGFIETPALLEKLKNFQIDTQVLDINLIRESISIKQKIVQLDPMEHGIRKTLNFGHTLGHAIETHYLSKSKKEQLLHGEAVAIGMIMALHLSHQLLGFDIEKLRIYSQLMLRFYTDMTGTTRYQLPLIDLDETSSIINLLQHDKKNNKGRINFILLKDIGKPVIDCQVTHNQIIESINFYNNIHSNHLK